MPEQDYAAVRSDIVKLLHQPEYDDGSAGPVLVRLAWHSAGTYDAETDTGGSNGAGMPFSLSTLYRWKKYREGRVEWSGVLRGAEECREVRRGAETWTNK